MGTYAAGVGAAFSCQMKLWHLGRCRFVPGEACSNLDICTCVLHFRGDNCKVILCDFHKAHVFFVVVLCFNLSFSSPFATCNMKNKA